MACVSAWLGFFFSTCSAVLRPVEQRLDGIGEAAEYLTFLVLFRLEMPYDLAEQAEVFAGQLLSRDLCLRHVERRNSLTCF